MFTNIELRGIHVLEGMGLGDKKIEGIHSDASHVVKSGHNTKHTNTSPEPSLLRTIQNIGRISMCLEAGTTSRL
jgi:hypothetical protein